MLEIAQENAVFDVAIKGLIMPPLKNTSLNIVIQCLHTIIKDCAPCFEYKILIKRFQTTDITI